MQVELKVKEGPTIIRCDIWHLVLMLVLDGHFRFRADRVDLFVDGKRVETPESFDLKD